LKTIDSALTTLYASTDNRYPISKVELYQTPWVCSSYGINVVAWRDDNDTSRTPDFGVSIDGSYDALTTTGVMVTNQCWDGYGYSRPFGFNPDEDLLARYEGYLYAGSGNTVDFKVVCNTSGHLYAETGAGTYPSAVTNLVLSATSTGNADALTAQTGSVSIIADWVPFRFDHYVSAGNLGKVVILYKDSSESQYKLLDVSAVNTTGSWVSPTELSGVLSINGTNEVDKPARASVKLVKSSFYDYDQATDTYGVIKNRRYIKISAGHNTNTTSTGYEAPNSTDYVPMGHYLIDDIQLTKNPQQEVLNLAAIDPMQNLVDSINVPLLPSLITYDVFGLNSDGVFDETDGLTRYNAFDSWTLSNTIRALLYHSDFTSDQVWATDSNGNYKIASDADNIRLSRNDFFRLKLSNIEKVEQDLKYAYDPEKKLIEIVREFVELYNYEFLIDSEGHPVLRAKNTGVTYFKSEGALGTASVATEHAGSLGGKYWTVTGSNDSFRLASIGNWTGQAAVFTLESGSAAITSWLKGGVEQLSSNINISSDYAWSYRDGIDPRVNTNPCIINLGRGYDSSTDSSVITVSSGAKFCGWIVYNDDSNLVDVTFGKDQVEQLAVNQSARDLRNDCTVIGAEKGFDSDEWYTSRTINIESVMSPSAPNFVGRRQKVLLPQEGVRRQDVVDFISYATAFRHSRITDNVNYSIPAHFGLEIGDTINITDDTAGTSGTNFYANQISWNLAAGNASMSARLDSFTPVGSYQPLKAPISPTNVIDNFLVSRTDGADFTPNTNTSDGAWGTTASTTGYYNPIWDTNESPPVQVKIDFDLYRNSTVHLVVKDLQTLETLAVLVDNEPLQYGSYTFYWNGRVWNDGHSEYRLYPNRPSFTDTGDWENWQGQKDLFDSSNSRGRTGYCFVELNVIDDDDDTARPSMETASNGSDTTKNYFKVKLSSKDVVAVTDNNNTKYLSGNGGAAAYGGRDEIIVEELNDSGGPYGFRVDTSHLTENIKLVWEGSLDVDIVGMQATTGIQVGDMHIKAWQKWNPQTLSLGKHLYRFPDGADVTEYELIGGETEFLGPGQNYFAFDLENMMTLPDPSENGFKASTITKSNLPDTDVLREEENKDYPRKEFRWTPDYLTRISGMYPEFAAVGASYVFTVKLHGINQAGERIEMQAPFAPIRIESETVSGNKHFVWPPTDVVHTIGSASFTINAGEWARTRTAKEYDDQYASDEKRIVHFTSNVNIDDSYD